MIFLLAFRKIKTSKAAEIFAHRTQNLSNSINSMVADGLTTQGARESETMELTG